MNFDQAAKRSVIRFSTHPIFKYKADLYATILLFITFISTSFAQETPPLINYPSSIYKAHNQNWAIDQSVPMTSFIQPIPMDYWNLTGHHGNSIHCLTGRSFGPFYDETEIPSTAGKVHESAAKREQPNLRGWFFRIRLLEKRSRTGN
jgi:hypothetical protein